MEPVFRIYSVLAAVVALYLLGAALRVRLGRRRRPWQEALEQKYLRMVVHALMSGNGCIVHFPQIGRARARLLLAEVISGVVTSTYGLDMELLRGIVTRCGLDVSLLRRVRLARGYRRAYYLSLLAVLPVGETALREVGRFGRDRNRYVRFYALMTQLAYDPAMSLKLIAEYPPPLSAYEISEIMALLRRGVLPVAYGPLVVSENRNLRALGLAIVRQYGIEEAERQLLRIVGDVEGQELSREALFILCSLRRPLARRAVVRRVARMNRTERRALLRHMAFEGYAAEALPRFFNAEERPYYESLVSSYKRCLVCS